MEKSKAFRILDFGELKSKHIGIRFSLNTKIWYPLPTVQIDCNDREIKLVSLAFLVFTISLFYYKEKIYTLTMQICKNNNGTFGKTEKMNVKYKS